MESDRSDGEEVRRVPDGKDQQIAIDWEAIKAAYAVGSDSLSEIAERFGVAQTAVSKHSSADGWVDARKTYRAKLAKAAMGEAEGKDAAILTSLLGSIEKLTHQIAKALDDPDQLHRHLVQVGSGDGGFETIEKRFDKLDWVGARAVAQTLKDLTAVARDLLGIRSRQQAEEFAIVTQRLELERAKAALGEQTDEGTGVILLPAQAEMPAPPPAEDDEQGTGDGADGES